MESVEAETLSCHEGISYCSNRKFGSSTLIVVLLLFLSIRKKEDTLGLEGESCRKNYLKNDVHASFSDFFLISAESCEQKEQRYFQSTWVTFYKVVLTRSLLKIVSYIELIFKRQSYLLWIIFASKVLQSWFSLSVLW